MDWRPAPQQWSASYAAPQTTRCCPACLPGHCASLACPPVPTPACTSDLRVLLWSVKCNTDWLSCHDVDHCQLSENQACKSYMFTNTCMQTRCKNYVSDTCHRNWLFHLSAELSLCIQDKMCKTLDALHLQQVSTASVTICHYLSLFVTKLVAERRSRNGRSPSAIIPTAFAYSAAVHVPFSQLIASKVLPKRHTCGLTEDVAEASRTEHRVKAHSHMSTSALGIAKKLRGVDDVTRCLQGLHAYTLCCQLS